MSFSDILKLIWIMLSLLAAGLIYSLAILTIGGGWAYAGQNGCHFQLNLIGYLMLFPPVIVLGALLRLLVRKA